MSLTIINDADVTCNGGNDGTAEVAVSGGSVPYTYSWLPTGGTAAIASGLAASTYTVEVTDNNGCTGTTTVIIDEPDALVLNLNPTDITCNGGADGSIQANVSGGQAPYNYSWSPFGGTTSLANNLPIGTYIVTVTDANGCTITASATLTEPSVMSVAIVSNNVTCNGLNDGQATANLTGGTGPFNYNWSPTGITSQIATGLGAGAHSVVVTDINGCTATDNVIISQPSLLSSTISHVDVSCNGVSDGQITVVATGGDIPYSYSWSSGAGNTATANTLSAGIYTVTVTDNSGCTTTKSATIVEPVVLTASISRSNDVSCFGASDGDATVQASNGTAPYTYAWSSGGTTTFESGLIAGVYIATVTDINGCSASTTVTINQPSTISVAINGTNVSCNGGIDGEALAIPSGGVAPYTYFWSPSGGTVNLASGLSAGTYTVTVFDANGCSASNSVIIGEPITLAVSTTISNAFCSQNNGFVTANVTGGTGSYSYAWSPTGGSSSTASSLYAGVYTVTVTDANGCTITISAIVNDQNGPSAFISNTTDVSCNGDNDGTATVSVSSGTLPYTYAWSPTGGTGATGVGLTANMYTVLVTDANGCTVVATATISEPTAVVASITGSTNVNCNGGNDGTATVSGSGGVGSYSYNWISSGNTAATETGLTAGMYVVEVADANGCTASTNVSISQPPAMSISMSQTDVTCNAGNDGSASVIVLDGTGPYTYFWAPNGQSTQSISGLTAGTYTVTATDVNGCTISGSVTLIQPNAIVISNTVTDATCAQSNGSISAAVVGGTGSYSYSWFPSGGSLADAVNLAPGIYTVQVTDASGCTATVSSVVNNIAAPTATISATTDVSCFGLSDGDATATVIGGTAPYTYAWSPNGGTAATGTNLSAGALYCFCNRR